LVIPVEGGFVFTTDVVSGFVTGAGSVGFWSVNKVNV
jgi:hypothetical protein